MIEAYTTLVWHGHSPCCALLKQPHKFRAPLRSACITHFQTRGMHRHHVSRCRGRIPAVDDTAVPELSQDLSSDQVPAALAATKKTRASSKRASAASKKDGENVNAPKTRSRKSSKAAEASTTADAAELAAGQQPATQSGTSATQLHAADAAGAGASAPSAVPPAAPSTPPWLAASPAALAAAAAAAVSSTSPSASAQPSARSRSPGPGVAPAPPAGAMPVPPPPAWLSQQAPPQQAAPGAAPAGVVPPPFRVAPSMQQWRQQRLQQPADATQQAQPVQQELSPPAPAAAPAATAPSASGPTASIANPSSSIATQAADAAAEELEKAKRAAARKARAAAKLAAPSSISSVTTDTATSPAPVKKKASAAKAKPVWASSWAGSTANSTTSRSASDGSIVRVNMITGKVLGTKKPAAGSAGSTDSSKRALGSASFLSLAKGSAGVAAGASKEEKWAARKSKLAALSRQEKAQAEARAREQQDAGGGSSSADAGPGAIVQIATGAWAIEGFSEDLQGLPAAAAALAARLGAAVAAEQEAEKRLVRWLYQSSSLRKLQEDGLVLAGLQAKFSHQLYRNQVYRLALPTSKELQYHRFRQGDNILLSPMDSLSMGQTRGSAGSAKGTAAAARARLARGRGADGQGQRASSEGDSDSDDEQDWAGIDGVVLELRRGHLMVAVEGKQADVIQRLSTAGAGFSGLWRIDQSVRDTTTKRQLEALRRLDSFTDASQPAPGEVLLRLALLGSRHAAYISEQPPVWVREDRWRADARAALAGQEGLNDSQRRAIAGAMVRTVSLWQGPPGTGKTRTLLAMMAVLVATAKGSAARRHAMGPLLATAGTNAAVDNLLEGLEARGIKAVRVGNPAKVRESLRHMCVEALAERTVLGGQALALRQAAQELQAQARELAAGGSTAGRSRALAMEQRARQDMGKADAMLREASSAVIQTAEVVCATCSGAGDSSLSGRSFRLVLVDESSQATEPAVLVPLVRGAQWLVLAGDPRQLPPTITSEKAFEYALDVTLFDRLAELGLAPSLLDTQYRMHPAIAQFPAAWFYAGRLKDGVTAQQKPPPAGLAWPVPGWPVAVVEVEGREEAADSKGGKRAAMERAASESAVGTSSGASYRNMAEARATLDVAAALLAAGDISSCAILAPYKGQVRALEQLVRAAGPGLVPAGCELVVSSVDGYQGREADVVVFSTVRCNDKGAIGFVSDPRRLNVAITRPRRGLVLVGSPSTLQRGSRDWAQYAKWARANRVVVGLEQLLGRGADGVAADGKGGGVGVEEDGEELGEDGGAGEEDVVVQVA